MQVTLEEKSLTIMAHHPQTLNEQSIMNDYMRGLTTMEEKSANQMLKSDPLIFADF